MSEPTILEFIGDGSADDYHAYVATDAKATTPHARKIRADKWKAKNPKRWRMVYPPDAVLLTVEQQNAFRYKVETPPAPPVMLVTDRPADAGYDTWNFDLVHPAIRR